MYIHIYIYIYQNPKILKLIKLFGNEQQKIVNIYRMLRALTRNLFTIKYSLSILQPKTQSVIHTLNINN